MEQPQTNNVSNTNHINHHHEYHNPIVHHHHYDNLPMNDNMQRPAPFQQADMSLNKQYGLALGPKPEAAKNGVSQDEHYSHFSNPHHFSHLQFGAGRANYSSSGSQPQLSFPSEGLPHVVEADSAGPIIQQQVDVQQFVTGMNNQQNVNIQFVPNHANEPGLDMQQRGNVQQLPRQVYHQGPNMQQQVPLPQFVHGQANNQVPIFPQQGLHPQLFPGQAYPQGPYIQQQVPLPQFFPGQAYNQVPMIPQQRPLPQFVPNQAYNQGMNNLQQQIPFQAFAHHEMSPASNHNAQQLQAQQHLMARRAQQHLRAPRINISVSASMQHSHIQENGNNHGRNQSNHGGTEASAQMNAIGQGGAQNMLGVPQNGTGQGQTDGMSDHSATARDLGNSERHSPSQNLTTPAKKPIKSAFQASERTNVQPAGQPDEGAVRPADSAVSVQPAESAVLVQPAESTVPVQPAESNIRPAENVAQPVEKIARPIEKIDQPAKTIDQPAVNIDQPAENIDQPVDNDDDIASWLDENALLLDTSFFSPDESDVNLNEGVLSPAETDTLAAVTHKTTGSFSRGGMPAPKMRLRPSENRTHPMDDMSRSRLRARLAQGSVGRLGMNPDGPMRFEINGHTYLIEGSFIGQRKVTPFGHEIWVEPGTENKVQPPSNPIQGSARGNMSGAFLGFCA